MKNYESNEIYKQIDKSNIPSHVAIIMDGNGRWAKKRSMPRTYGHYHGAKNVVNIVRTCSNIGIKDLSLYTFSTENWSRPKSEVDKIMSYIVQFIDDYIDELDMENVHLRIFGDIDILSEKIKDKINYAYERTSSNTGMNLNMCINYGGRQEILRACKNIAKEYKEGQIEDMDDFSLENFKSYLYSKDSSDVDLLIRPSDELRISNFLLYQIAYSEMYFSNVLWPDFKEDDLFEAILSYQDRDRRFGGLSE